MIQRVPTHCSASFAIDDQAIDSIHDFLEGRIGDIVSERGDPKYEIVAFEPFIVRVSFSHCEDMPLRMWNYNEVGNVDVEWVANLQYVTWSPDGTVTGEYEVRQYDRLDS